jgi:hypothetical protein
MDRRMGRWCGHHVDVVGGQFPDGGVESAAAESVFVGAGHQLGPVRLRSFCQHEMVVLFRPLAEHQYLLQLPLQLPVPSPHSGTFQVLSCWLFLGQARGALELDLQLRAHLQDTEIRGVLNKNAVDRVGKVEEKIKASFSVLYLHLSSPSLENEISPLLHVFVFGGTNVLPSARFFLAFSVDGSLPSLWVGGEPLCDRRWQGHPQLWPGPGCTSSMRMRLNLTGH